MTATPRRPRHAFVGAVVAALMALTFGLVVSQPANAAPASPCANPKPVSGTTHNAAGSTPAHVSMTLWKCPDGGLYLSANSFAAPDGWFFKGTITVFTSGTPITKSCGRGVCDTSSTKDFFNGEFRTTNGQFFFLDGKAGCSGSSTFTVLSYLGGCG